MTPFRSFAVAVALLLVSTSAFAQRPVPGENGGAAFVEQADPGSLCPSCQLLLLKDSYASPQPVNPYDPTLETKVKPVVDVLIYNGATGVSLLVKTSPYGYVPGGFSVLSIWENIEWVTLRENMFWTVGDLDGDGRDDLAGHDKRTGEVVRVYRRGAR